MSYLGNNPSTAPQAKHQILDDITFDGVAVSYPLTVNATPQFPSNAADVIITLNGVIQSPEVAFNISGSNIVFTGVPEVGSTFSGIVLGTTYETSVPLTSTISGIHLQIGAVDLAGNKVSGVLPASMGGTGSTVPVVASINGLTGAVTDIAVLTSVQTLTNKTLGAGTIFADSALAQIQSTALSF